MRLLHETGWILDKAVDAMAGGPQKRRRIRAAKAEAEAALAETYRLAEEKKRLEAEATRNAIVGAQRKADFDARRAEVVKREMAPPTAREMASIAVEYATDRTMIMIGAAAAATAGLVELATGADIGRAATNATLAGLAAWGSLTAFATLWPCTTADGPCNPRLGAENRRQNAIRAVAQVKP